GAPHPAAEPRSRVNFSDEDFVRIYVRFSATARIWGFFGRMLMDAMVKAADPAGIVWLPEDVELLDDRFLALASVLECPDVGWVREHLPKIEEHGAVIYEQLEDGRHYFFIPRYYSAQYSPQS